MHDAPVRVLLVDDDEFAYNVVHLDLSEISGARFQVEWRSRYDVGMEAIASEAYDVCLLDFQLGDRSGLDFLKEAVRRGCRTPIVMLTAQGGHELDLEAMRAGAADYLVKGEFGPPLLERCLRYAIERARTQEALRESEERYALAVAGANDGLWDWKLATNEVYFSARWKSILGYDDEEFTNLIDEWYLRVHPDDLARLKDDIAKHLAGQTAHFENEHRILHKDGTYRFVVSRGLAVPGINGLPSRLAGSQRDVTQTRGHDPLTSLPNRVLYLDRLARVIERAKRRNDYGFAVLFLDLDRFKIVNDSLGHVAGDELIVGIAKRLQLCVRSADTVARLGGDEFTVLLEDLEDPSHATRIARRVQDALAEPFSIFGREVFTSASIGIAMGSAVYERPEELLRDADTAMYRAKASGKSRHEVFDKAMHARAVAALHLETELRRAVECQDFLVQYQPIISLQTGGIVSAEALVRWKHPVRGMVPPDEFIPLAEETGLVVQIDRYVMRKASAQMRDWQLRFREQAPLTIAVNVSKKQLAQSDFAEEVERVLAETQLPAEALSLEITESIIMENAEMASAMFARLRARNVNLIMDDFGTGYSSLAYLHKLPFNCMKIDRSFVSRLGKEDDTCEIIRAILTIARSLGVPVTAEGIETHAQLEALRELGCDYAQGYLFSRPVDVATLEGLLVSGPSW